MPSPALPFSHSPDEGENPLGPGKLGENIDESETGSVQGELFDTTPPPWELADDDDVAIASVVFSDAPHGPYDYRVPDEHRETLQAGMRVRVPLGHRRKLTSGWCVEVKTGSAAQRSLKEVGEVLDESPLCDPPLVRLVRWMSHYYQTSLGQVFDTIVPSSVRSAAGTRKQIYLTANVEVATDAVIEKLPAKQQAAMRALIISTNPMTQAQLAAAAGCTESPIRTLRSRGLIQDESRREMQAGPPVRWQTSDGETESDHDVTADQAAALKQITAAIDSGEGRTLLLHGVTGSGKTEVYIRAIEYLIRFRRSAIVLVPEISLTPQTRGRFERRFQSVAVLHSQMSPAERHFQWQRIRSGEVQVVVGPRSAVFAPLPRLGMIFIDEEHDSSFKQDTQPRYHARKVAHARAMSLKIPLVLGSATPSLESWQAAKNGHAELLSMPVRVNDRPMPDVHLVDLRVRDDRTFGSISRPLHTAVEETLAEKRASNLVAEPARIRNDDSVSCLWSRRRLSRLRDAADASP